MAVIVAENYCIACEGECANKDPEDYAHLLMEWDQLTGAWLDRGASHASIWSFMAAAVMHIAQVNGVTWDELRDELEAAWKRQEDKD